MVEQRDQVRSSKPHTAVIDQGSLVSQLERIQGRRAMLVFLSGSNVGGMIPLASQAIVLGREIDCDVILTDDGVSRRHAKIGVEADGSYSVNDLGSTNGTMVNGSRISQHALHDGDRIALGRLILKFVMQADVDEEYQKRIYEMSIRDPLTRAYNRRYFDERLASEIAYARRHESLVSLVMIDIDHFKRLNDTYGHLAGDRALVEVSAFALKQVRSEDVFARYGGEEFVVLARETPGAGLAVLAERIRSGIAELKVSCGELQVTVTVSVGAVTVKGSRALTGEGLIEAADRLMYKAKQAGRNRVFTEGEGA